MAEHKSNGEEVIIASVQSLVRRLNKFPKDYFDMIIIDETVIMLQHLLIKKYWNILITD